MRTFKKTIAAVAILLCTVVLLSAIIIEPMILKGHLYYTDADLRKSLAGDIDLFFIGDSDGMSAFRPEVFDELNGCCSYNLSGTMMTTGSIKYLLEKELQRNPVKTVMLQVSQEMLCRDLGNELGDGESVTIQRLDNVWERYDYLFSHVKFDDWLNVYSRLLVSGIVDWKETLTGNDVNRLFPEDKGWHRNTANNLTLAEENVAELYNSMSIDGKHYDFYEQEFSEIIDMAKGYGAEVKIIILPVADSYIWKIDNWDEFRNWSEEFCKSKNIELIDFNLYKGRYELFFDNGSYQDYAHMSEAGADNFTRCLATVLSENSDEDFYNSYADMKMDSPYARILDK